MVFNTEFQYLPGNHDLVAIRICLASDSERA